MQTGLKTKGPVNIVRGNSGFTLVEIMIAITVFALFATAYVASEGFNISDSSNMRQELFLQKLCENKVNQLLIKIPELKESLTLVPMTGTFEDEGYPDFEYTVEFKKLIIPDLKKIQGEKGDGQNNNENGASQQQKWGDHSRWEGQVGKKKKKQ